MCITNAHHCLPLKGALQIPSPPPSCLTIAFHCNADWRLALPPLPPLPEQSLKVGHHCSPLQLVPCARSRHDPPPSLLPDHCSPSVPAPPSSSTPPLLAAGHQCSPWIPWKPGQSLSPCFSSTQPSLLCKQLQLSPLPSGCSQLASIALHCSPLTEFLPLAYHVLPCFAFQMTSKSLSAPKPFQASSSY